MNVAIRYYTKTGNTKKLADAIAEVTGISAMTVDTPLEENIDILFLGSSVYAAGVDEQIKKFIKTLDPLKVKRVVNFSTAALIPSTFSQVTKLLNIQGITIDEQEFHCRGKFKFMHKQRPDENDIKEIKKFVQKIINN